MHTFFKLKTPIKGPHGMIDELKMREPKFEDYAELGDPHVPVSLGEDSFMWRPIPSTMRAYVEKLVDLDPNLLPQLTLPDTLTLYETIMSFFRQAADDTSKGSSAAPPTSSSSPLDSDSDRSVA